MLAERRWHNAGRPVGARERLRFVEHRPRISPKTERGWLAFEASDGERRRLAPFPGGSSEFEHDTDDQLRSWRALAEPAPPGA